jgi:alkanesulfonate monooxygenase SsuD/methylene tetrahydromethanopterin reductase-like flavin-dependent oxidoreductase (luciferase family)
VKYGFVLPYGNARTAADFAFEAEQAGWDGFFVWEPVWGWDAWMMLTAAAMRTERIKLGTMITPVSRMRPWELASKTVTLDHLSNGRVILAVGLGAIDTGFAEFGEETDRKTRAELLDEGLDIVTGLWQGQPFNYDGQHYHIKETKFYPLPSPVQQPRIPIWVVGAWPKKKSMQRALRYDGLLPNVFGDDGRIRETTPDDARAMHKYAVANRSATTPFDIVAEGKTPGDDPDRAAEIVRGWANAGATWWIEALWGDPAQPVDLNAVLRRIQQGPPHTD